MHLWHEFPESRMHPEDFYAIIEITKGSKNKYELDKATGMLLLDRILYTSTHYPANYGFLPRTYADDGDPLDVLVICSEPILPMSTVRCRPIGLLSMLDGGRRDEKIFAVPMGDPNYRDVEDVSQLPDHVFAEIRHFFTVYKDLEHKQTIVDDVKGREEAVAVVESCLAAYRAEFGA